MRLIEAVILLVFAACISPSALAANVLAVIGQSQVIRLQQPVSVVVGMEVEESDALLLSSGAEVLVQFDDRKRAANTC